jgi:LPS export ABC transporter protein LptC
MKIPLLNNISNTQKFFLSIGLVFCLSLGYSVYHFSKQTTSLPKASVIAISKDSIEPLSSVEVSRSGLRMQDFHRVDVKDGKTVWEIIAKDARYFALERLAFVNDAIVRIYRSPQSSIVISSDAGKLYLDDVTISQAELEGNIEVVLDESLSVRTQTAQYDKNKGEITSTSHVYIFGPGYEIQGVGLKMVVDEETVDIFKDVESRFEVGARPLQQIN